MTNEVVEGESTEHALEEAKQLLMKLAGGERACMQVCWEELSPSLDEYTRWKMKAFNDVADLFGEIYVARDIASKVHK